MLTGIHLTLFDQMATVSNLFQKIIDIGHAPISWHLTPARSILMAEITPWTTDANLSFQGYHQSAFTSTYLLCQQLGDLKVRVHTPRSLLNLSDPPRYYTFERTYLHPVAVDNCLLHMTGKTNLTAQNLHKKIKEVVAKANHLFDTRCAAARSLQNCVHLGDIFSSSTIFKRTMSDQEFETFREFEILDFLSSLETPILQILADHF